MKFSQAILVMGVGTGVILAGCYGIVCLIHGVVD